LNFVLILEKLFDFSWSQSYHTRMKTGQYTDVKEELPPLPGAQSTIRWLVSEKDGARNFAMRVIEIKRRGVKIPLHAHDYEHETFVIAGQGRAFTKDKSEAMKFGDFAFVPANEEHGFENTGDEPFRFICVIPIRKG
jgi:quercetin dioxygenase-like cupin family protein